MLFQFIIKDESYLFFYMQTLILAIILNVVVLRNLDNVFKLQFQTEAEFLQINKNQSLKMLGNSLAVQWLGLGSFTHGTGFHRGTEMPQDAWWGQK